jgi:integrase/recombinase XerC
MKSLNDIKEEFLAQYSMSSEKTKFKYRNELDLFFNVCEIFTIKDLNSFNELKLEKMYNYAKEKEWNANTINQRLGTAKLFFIWCLNKRYIDSNFLANVKRIRIVNKVQFTPKKEDVDKLLQSILKHTSKTRLYIMVKLLSYTALRRFEICNLKIQDINKENNSIIVKGKGNTIIEQPVPSEIINELLFYIKTERKQVMDIYTKLGGKDLQYLFVSGVTENANKSKNLKDGNKVKQNSFYEQIKRHTKIANLPNYELWDIHCLRRFVGTQVYEKTGDIKTASECLRHASVSTTEKCYIDYDRKKITNVVNSIYDDNNKEENQNKEYEEYLRLKEKFAVKELVVV